MKTGIESPLPPESHTKIRGGFVSDEDTDRLTFRQKAESCLASGAQAALVFNDRPGPYTGTLGEEFEDLVVWSVDGTVGQELFSLATGGATIRVFETEERYGFADGTSFSAPIISGTVAALRRYVVVFTYSLRCVIDLSLTSRHAEPAHCALWLRSDLAWRLQPNK